MMFKTALSPKMIKSTMNRLKRFFHPRLIGKTVRAGRRRRETLFYNPPPLRAFIFGGGTAFLLLAIILASIWYFPLISAFWRYKFGPPLKITPPIAAPTQKIDYHNFFIFIPKIKAKAKVFANTPTDNRQKYLDVLQRGVAHAKGSGFPGQGKTIYLFAHSTNSPFYATRLNAVFMLLDQLQSSDVIIIYFSGHQYRYKVVKKIIVSPKATSYIHSPPINNRETLILQTCYPPGTIWKRLLVFATFQKKI